MGTGTLGVDNTLGDTLTVKVGQLVKEGKVLEEAIRVNRDE